MDNTLKSSTDCLRSTQAVAYEAQGGCSSGHCEATENELQNSNSPIYDQQMEATYDGITEYGEYSEFHSVDNNSGNNSASAQTFSKRITTALLQPGTNRCYFVK